jgi:MgtC family protein
VVQGIVTGIGFLGTGVIVRSDQGGHVHGLTTAACVWGNRVPWRSLWTQRMADRSPRFANSFDLTLLWRLF